MSEPESRCSPLLLPRTLALVTNRSSCSWRWHAVARFVDQTEIVFRQLAVRNRNGIFRKRESDCLAPALVFARNGVAGCAICHSVKPPALFWSKSKPILDGCWDQRGIGILNRPSQQNQLFAKQSRDRSR